VIGRELLEVLRGPRERRADLFRLLLWLIVRRRFRDRHQRRERLLERERAFHEPRVVPSRQQDSRDDREQDRGRPREDPASVQLQELDHAPHRGQELVGRLDLFLGHLLRGCHSILHFQRRWTEVSTGSRSGPPVLR